MGWASTARRLAPAGLALILAVLFFAPATVGPRVLSASDIPLFSPPFPPQPPGARPQNPLQFDAATVFEPDGLVVRDALRDWRLPTWTAAQSAGQPLLAAQQSAPLFPLTWLSAVLPFWDSLAWIAVAKLVLAFMGTWMLGRALGLSGVGRLIAALSFAFGTYLIDWLSHPHANAYVLLPWLFLAVERLVERRRPRDAGLLALALGLAYLGGQPESSLIVTLAAGAWLLYRNREARTLALAGGALVAGVALAAVMLVPFVEALRQSFDVSRSQPPLSGKSVLTLVFPEFWGRPDRPGFSGGPDNFTERTLYVGALPLLLAVAGLCARRPRGPMLFFAALAFVALVVGVDTGPITRVVRHIPLLHVSDVNRVIVLAAFALSMLAGYGWERLRAAGAEERRRMLIGGGVLAFLPVVVAVLSHPSWFGHLPDALRHQLGGDPSADGDVVAFGSVLRWLGFAVAAAAIVTVPALSRWRAPLLTALVVFDLFAMGWGYNPAITKSEADPPAPPGVVAARGVAAGGGRVIGLGALIPNTASRWDLRDSRGHEDPVVERTERLWQTLASGVNLAFLGGRPRDISKPLDVFGVRAVVLGPPGSDLARRLIPALPNASPVYAGSGATVLDNRSALPPAFVAYHWRTSGGIDDSLRQMRAGSSRQARDDPVIETGPQAQASEAIPATLASVTSRSDTEVTVSVNALKPGRLVLLDTYYPGWKATVDGRSAHIEAADAAFRSVAVAAGRHTVRFSYRPASVLWGGIVSLLALAAILICIGFRRSEEGADATE
jgi:hypothetical protein